MTQEIWKDLDFSKKYEISNLGRVRNKLTDRILKQSIQSSGNAIVCLSIDGKVRTYSVGRLILNTFMPTPNSDKYVVGYKDNNKSNNVLDNLFWTQERQYTKFHLVPNEFKELKNSLMITIDQTFQEWCEKYIKV